MATKSVNMNDKKNLTQETMVVNSMFMSDVIKYLWSTVCKRLALFVPLMLALDDNTPFINARLLISNSRFLYDNSNSI